MAETLTSAQRRILNHLADHGPTQFWPVGILPNRAPLGRLQDAGYVERLNRATPGPVVYHITPKGRAALPSEARPA